MQLHPGTKLIVSSHRPTIVEMSTWTDHVWVHCSCGAGTFLLQEFVGHISHVTRESVMQESITDEVP